MSDPNPESNESSGTFDLYMTCGSFSEWVTIFFKKITAKIQSSYLWCILFWWSWLELWTFMTGYNTVFIMDGSASDFSKIFRDGGCVGSGWHVVPVGNRIISRTDTTSLKVNVHLFSVVIKSPKMSWWGIWLDCPVSRIIFSEDQNFNHTGHMFLETSLSSRRSVRACCLTSILRMFRKYSSFSFEPFPSTPLIWVTPPPFLWCGACVVELVCPWCVPLPSPLPPLPPLPTSLPRTSSP